MKTKIKQIIKSLNPSILGVESIHIDSLRKLGVGEGNVNYILKIDNKKFIVRKNITKDEPYKSINEYKSLKQVEDLNIAPKVYYRYHKGAYLNDFLILDYISGKSMYKGKRKYTKNQLTALAKLLASLHNKKNVTLPKRAYAYSFYLKEGLKATRLVSKYNDKLESELKHIHKLVKAQIPSKEKHKFSLIHGDLCPPNIVETKVGMKLIDWEALRYGDPAIDIANILVDMGFNKKDFDLFMIIYQKLRKDKTILERSYIYKLLTHYVYFVYELV